MRRKPKPELVRHTLRNLPANFLLDEYGEKIVVLRGEMQRALDALDANDVVAAKRTLRRALHERWWR